MKEKIEKKETVYIIDSGNDFRFVCRESLTNLGFHVVGDSGDGGEALLAIKNLQPQVVLLDLWFPGYDLASLIRELRRDLRGKAPKFILVTGINNKKVLEDAFASGISSCVLKPFDYEAFAAWPGVAEAVVTDLNTGEAAYLPVRRDQRGFRVLQASCSLPLLFPVVRLNGVPCLDGGLADAIPFRRALEQGCDRVVVVLTRERGYWKKPDKNMIRLIRQTYRQYPNLVALIERQAERYNKLREELFRLEQEGRVMVVAPETTAGFKRLEKDVEKIRDLYQQGYDVAREQMGAIKAYLAGD